MNLKNVEKQEKNVVVLTIEIPAAEFDAACEKVYRQMRGRLNVHGFRKGKAPGRSSSACTAPTSSMRTH